MESLNYAVSRSISKGVFIFLGLLLAPFQFVCCFPTALNYINLFKNEWISTVLRPKKTLYAVWK